MEKRTENILNAVIESFIKNGVPVSSGSLYEKYDFGIRPAMIRHELENLTETGYLEQPYHSAGRIPSDNAYEFFVSKILLDETETSLDNEFQKCLHDQDWFNFVDLFSSHLNLLSALEPETEERVYKTGLETLIDNLSWDSQKEIKEIIRDFEELDQKIENFNSKTFHEDSIQVFVGKKSPFTASNGLSVVIKKCNINGRNLLLLAIGPKRMNYKKVVKTFKSIKETNGGNRK